MMNERGAHGTGIQQRRRVDAALVPAMRAEPPLGDGPADMSRRGLIDHCMKMGAGAARPTPICGRPSPIRSLVKPSTRKGA